MDLLRRHGWAVVPGSHAGPFDKVTGVRDAQSGTRGIWFCVGTIEWSGQQAATVYGEVYVDGKDAEGASYQVVCRADTWVVTSRKSIWKS
jgi:hypothetical protein